MSLGILEAPGIIGRRLSRRICRGGAFLFASLLLAAPSFAVKVTFTYVPDSPQTSIYLAGTFNSWASDALAMQANDSGAYSVSLDLEPGRYLYKYVVGGTSWKEDPLAPDGYEDDGFGGKNGIVVVPSNVENFAVGPTDAGLPSESADTAAAPNASDAEQVTGLRKVTFKYQPPIGGVQQMMLAGTFNDWNIGANPMSDDNNDGVWSTTIMLSPGTYQYKFVVDGNWITDTEADDFAPDGFGGKNSVILVDSRFEKIAVGKGDGKFYLEDVRYSVDYSTVNPINDHQLVFTARSHIDDVERIDVVLRSQAGEQTVALRQAGQDPSLEYWRTTVTVEPLTRVRFVFQYHDGSESTYMTPQGPSDQVPADKDFFIYDPEQLPIFEVSEWVRDGVIYQIFPERFFNGDPSNDPDFTEAMYKGKTKLPASGKTNSEYFHMVRSWTDIGGLRTSPYRTDGRPDYYSFYGGDIEGVRQKLSYLEDLGITIIYFNPLNVARSNHKYDPCDYLSLDPHFGDKETFQRFVREAHALGIRIIVDMAYNHSGDCHFAFQDAWEKGKESEYWNWYEWKRWPPPAGAEAGSPGFKADDYYACWWGFGIHPELNFDLSRPQTQENSVRDIKQAQPNQPLLDYVMSSVDYWLGELDIDGFRLDVPNEVPFWFWGLFRDKVRAVKPDAYIVGEIWGNASEWVRPDVFDATMNYKFFRDPVQKFIGKGHGSAATFDRELAPGRWQYPQQSVEAMMNLVDSHDTIRQATLMQSDRQRHKLTTLFAMTYVGAPHLYYGGEIGLEGDKDPDCRRPFPWQSLKDPDRADMFAFHKKVIALRRSSPALRRGSFRTVLTEGMHYGYLRETDEERLLVLLNNSKAATTLRLPLEQLGISGTDASGSQNGGSMEDLLSNQPLNYIDGELSVPLQPLSGAVIRIPRNIWAERP